MADENYKEKVKFLRKYVDFSDLKIDLRKKLTPAQKRIITIYYEPLKEVSFYSWKDYGGKKETINDIAEIQGLRVPKKRLKRVPVPTRQIKSKVKVKKKVIEKDNKKKTIKFIEITSKSNREIFIPLEQAEMMLDAEAHLKERMGNMLKDDGGFYEYGKFSVFEHFSNTIFYSLEQAVFAFMAEYVINYPIDKYRVLEGVKLYYTGLLDSDIVDTRKKPKKKRKNRRDKNREKKSIKK